MLMTLAVAWTGGVSAQSNCMTAILSLSPCISYATGNSSVRPPSSSCCTQLSNIVRSTPQCLCSLLNGGASSFGVYINETLAALIPAACNLHTPPVSTCTKGSKRVPSTTDFASAGSGVRAPLHTLSIFLAAVSSALSSAIF
ncbi:unnamed protein product [Cuscuta campestris]|uniref:Bifunctional inhibitor/plant lipid transfer protein/seed storage helical domain-containing protein n=1 Tax=Cuscuta campestris TaxID=132261 RepID=A0A484M4S7_9ASTE|nr:unnamed protein product [Cuscuta campestris]